MTNEAANVLASLRQNSEYTEPFNGVEWGMVYLDNARPKGMSEKSFRSHLAALSKQGLYRVEDGFAWGLVKVEGAA